MQRLLLLLLLLALGCAGSRPTQVDRQQRRSSTVIAARESSTTSRVDARQLGVVANDEQDDTDAIQAAIDGAVHDGRAEVVLPPGLLYVSDRPPLDEVALRISAAGGMNLRGTGAAQTRLVLRSRTDAHVFAINDSATVTIQQLSVDGRRRDHHLGHGIRVANTTGLVLRDLQLRELAHYGIGLQRGTLANILIERVVIEDTGGDGIDFKNERHENGQLVLRQVQVSRPGQVSPRQAGIDIRGRASLSDIVVTDVPTGSAGIRFREDGPATGPGGHDSELTGFEIRGLPGSIGISIAAERVRVARGRVFGTEVGIAIQGNEARLADVLIESATAGILLAADGALVERARLEQTIRCGICVRAGARASRLVGNVFVGSATGVDDRGTETVVLPQ